MKKSELKQIIREEIRLMTEQTNARDFAQEIKSTIKKHFPKSTVLSDFSTNLVPSIHVAFALGRKEDWPNGYYENDVADTRISIYGMEKDGSINKPLSYEPHLTKVYIRPPEGSNLAYGSVISPVRKKKGDPQSILKAIDVQFATLKKVIKNNLNNLSKGHEYARKYV